MKTLLRRCAMTVILLVSVVTVVPTAATAKSDCPAGPCDPAADEQRTVRVAYSQFPPFSWTTQSGLADGYSINLIRMLLEPQGYTITFVPFDNPQQMLDNLSEGEVDMTTLLADNPVRREYGNFTSHLGTLDVRLFVDVDGISIRSRNDVVGKRVGAASGSAGYRLASGLDGAVVVPLNSSRDVLLPLLSGQVDAIASPAESIFYIAKKARLSHRVQATDIVLNQAPIGLLVAPSLNGLLTDLNAAIAAAESKGHLKRLYDQWFAAQPAPFTSRERLLTAAAILGAVLMLGYWARLHYVVLRRARKLQDRSELLSDTLDATGSSLMIFGEDMRPVYWNDAFARNFPKQLPLVRAGMNIKELLVAALQNGTLGESLDNDAALTEAERCMKRLETQGELTSIVPAPGGIVLRRRTMRLPNSRYALIATDVTDLMEAQSQLEGMTLQLEGANRRLTEFNRIAAHDLVAPLRNLRNLHGWIRDDIEELGIKLDSETLDNFESIDSLLNRQSTMIQDLLEYSGTSRDGGPRVFDPCERYRAVLELSNVPTGFRVILPSGTPKLRADPIAFDIVLRNLITNSVKHHDRDRGIVEIRCESTGSKCIFEVRDDGPGLPEDSLVKIFEPFERLKSRDDGAGTGLGLAFIKRAVNEWGGNVSAHSSDGQRGSTFRFDVPLAQHATESSSRGIGNLRA